eukprot:CAMPEP_0197679894 /NCGR_PEP_ID=MMETSP1338-20131121/92405_1 /TAXON_ID=43686 ORGANISM="Pelagodinium beii, Strain RCC1491" /NCGR_SAMPLE_ID=MMETSP1338 /ASSEMBLY_ACC=CAM_ASM_000754 /LENGTH=73 /DNA_ID=CAMNT_0043261005 /DNA_START=240 /DNA_END=461 /DNA_ORIENTATION=-
MPEPSGDCEQGDPIGKALCGVALQSKEALKDMLMAIRHGMTQERMSVSLFYISFLRNQQLDYQWVPLPSTHGQ